MKLSPAQLRALRNLDVAADTHGNALFHADYVRPGWYRLPRKNSRVKYHTTLMSLIVRGLVDTHPSAFSFRISPAGADELRQRGYVVYTQHAEPSAWKGGAE